MPGGAVFHDHRLVHVGELIGSDVDDEAGLLQPGVGLALLGAEHVVEVPEAVLLQELGQQQCGVAAAAGGEVLERGREVRLVAGFDGPAELAHNFFQMVQVQLGLDGDFMRHAAILHT